MRGLKLNHLKQMGVESHESHPARGVWIEIFYHSGSLQTRISRTPQGVRGLKSLLAGLQTTQVHRRTPQGVRGLKFGVGLAGLLDDVVAPRKGCVD